MAGAPGEPEPGRPARRPIRLRREQRRDGDEGVGIGRMAQAEQERDPEDDGQPTAGAESRDQLVEPEHASPRGKGRG